MKEKKQRKLKINVGTLLKEKVREVEDNTREVIIRRISREVVVCVQYALGKNNLPVKFEYGHKRYISASFISYMY